MPDPVPKLTRRQQQIVAAIRDHQRHTTRGIAVFTGLNEPNVAAHLRHIGARLGARNRGELIWKLRKEPQP